MVTQRMTSNYPSSDQVARSRRQKICLSMIVKDEASVIARCLASVRPLIDYWIIVDTGSTDETQDVIRNVLQDLPGELHQSPWVDFAHNRSEALSLARQHGDYTLIIDADDVLELPARFKMPQLTADSYLIEIRHRELHHWRPQIVRNGLPWRYEGVLHEFLSCGVDKKNQRILPDNRSQKRLLGPVIRVTEDQEGARRRQAASKRYSTDAAVLVRALEIETDPFLVSRYTFYLAQSYRDAGDKRRALQRYSERANLGFWDQEIFVSLYWSAKLKADLGFDEEEVVATFLQAHMVCKNRAEALHGASRFCRIKKKFQQGYDLAKRALHIRFPESGLFLEQWIYEYGVLDEYAITAYWIGKYDDCLGACERLLREAKIPDQMRERIEQNSRFAREKLSSQRLDAKRNRAKTLCLNMIVKNEMANFGTLPLPQSAVYRLLGDRRYRFDRWDEGAYRAVLCGQAGHSR